MSLCATLDEVAAISLPGDGSVLGGDGPRTMAKARLEIDTLRSINARLLQQIEQLKQREAQAQRLADRDGLTGLYNRRKMLALLDEALFAAAHHGHCMGLLFIDLDGFKGVNDRYGHVVGDKLLTIVASRLGARARTGDYVCRYGGDEFVVILSRAPDQSSIYDVADSLAARVALPYQVDGIPLTISAAVGAAIFPDEALDSAELMARADESMYLAKSSGLAPSALMYSSPARRRDDAARIGSRA